MVNVSSIIFFVLWRKKKTISTWVHKDLLLISDSKSFNWELCILVPGLAGFFIMLCSLCLWRHFAAVREALRCRCCHHGECEPLIRIHKNDLGKTEKTYRIKNKQGDKAVEHKDFGGKDKMVEPVQEEDVGDKSQTVGKNNVLSLIL